MNMRTPVLWAVLTCLGVGYLLQMASPLRTNTDAIEFLEIGASVSDGIGFSMNGKPSHYPPGYPLILAGLDRAGLACSAVLIGVNLVCLGAGLACACYVLSRSLGIGRDALLLLASMTLLSWVIVKHVTLPLSDIPYLGFSLTCLAAATRAAELQGRRKIFWLATATVLAMASISLRTIGVALLPALAFACVSDLSWSRLRDRLVEHRRLATLVGVAACVTIIAGAGILLSTRYAHEMIRDWRGPGDLVRFKLEDWGELLFNGPQSQVPQSFQPLVMVLGGVFASVVALGFRARKRITVVDVYIGAYLAILLVWPYRDARFWIPVIPLLLGYGWTAFPNEVVARRPYLRWAGGGYLAAYAAMGLLALVYSTWLSYSGDRFADRYAGGVYRASYQRAFGLEVADDLAQGPRDVSDHSDDQLDRILHRYRPWWNAGTASVAEGLSTSRDRRRADESRPGRQDDPRVIDVRAGRRGST